MMRDRINQLRSRLGQLREPDVLLRRVGEALIKQSKPARGAPSGVIQTLAEAVGTLRRIGARTVTAYGDPGFRDQLQAAWGEPCTWVSHRAADLAHGAIDPRSALEVDAIVVGGPELKLAYVHLLRLLVGRPAPHVLWVGDGFEFCFSTLPVPADATRAEIYLHNHFDAYFAMRDPLLLSIRATDGKTHHESQRIIAPRETIQISLDELLPARDGASFVELYTSHPLLTRGRHHRWRLCADVHWGNSFTTLHGAHDEGPDRPSHSRISSTLVGNGQLVVTVPNYELAAPSTLTRHEPGGKSKVERSATRPLEELRYRGNGERGHFAYEYVGHGTSFYYGMRDVRGHRVMFGNHESTIALSAAAKPLSTQRRAALDEIRAMLLPHALPVLDGPIELGFSFASATPTIDSYVARAYAADGHMIGEGRFRDPLAGPLFTDRIIELLALSQRPSLLVIGPDWRALEADPATFNMAGELVARDRESGDYDVTEFQSCWRNLGALVDEFPHWIHATNGLISRTRLVARAVHRGGMRTALVVVHASGDGDLAGDAHAEIQLLDPKGHARTHELVLPAFTSQTVWLDEVFDTSAALPDGFGTVLVLSPDRDLNVQLLTHDRDAHAVSLQHLWGY